MDYAIAYPPTRIHSKSTDLHSTIADFIRMCKSIAVMGERSTTEGIVQVRFRYDLSRVLRVLSVRVIGGLSSIYLNSDWKYRLRYDRYNFRPLTTLKLSEVLVLTQFLVKLESTDSRLQMLKIWLIRHFRQFQKGLRRSAVLNRCSDTNLIWDGCRWGALPPRKGQRPL